MDDSNGILMQLLGGLLAPDGPKEWKEFNDVVKFIEFESMTGLHITGVGLINGRGKGWWDISCRYHPKLLVISSSCIFIRFFLVYDFANFISFF